MIFFRAMRNLSLQTCVRGKKDRKKYLDYFVIVFRFFVLKEFADNIFFLQVRFSEKMFIELTHNIPFTCFICMWT